MRLRKSAVSLHSRKYILKVAMVLDSNIARAFETLCLQLLE